MRGLGLGFILALVLTPIVVLFGWSFIGLPISAVGFLTIKSNNDYVKVADKNTKGLNKVFFMNKVMLLLTIHLVIVSLVSIPWIGGFFIPDNIMSKDFIGNMLIYTIFSSALVIGYFIYIISITNKMPSYFEEKAKTVKYTEEDKNNIIKFIKSNYDYDTAYNMLDKLNLSSNAREAVGQITSLYALRDETGIPIEDYNARMKRTLKNIGIEDADY